MGRASNLKGSWTCDPEKKKRHLKIAGKDKTIGEYQRGLQV